MRFSATLYNSMRFGPNPSVPFRCVPSRLLLAVLPVWWVKVRPLGALPAVGPVLELAVAHLIRLYQCWNCIRDLGSASPGGHPLLESTQMQTHPIFFGSILNASQSSRGPMCKACQVSHSDRARRARPASHLGRTPLKLGGGYPPGRSARWIPNIACIWWIHGGGGPAGPVGPAGAGRPGRAGWTDRPGRASRAGGPSGPADPAGTADWAGPEDLVKL
eukprot:gene8953-biopygen7661